MVFTGPPWPPKPFPEEAEKKRPTVQVGDPFTEKLLLEACLKVMEGDSLVGDPRSGGGRLDQFSDGNGLQGRHWNGNRSFLSTAKGVGYEPL